MMMMMMMMMMMIMITVIYGMTSLEQYVVQNIYQKMFRIAIFSWV